MDWSIYLPYLLIMAAVTYLVRAVPYLLVKKKIENKFIKSFMAYIPYTVLSAMTFPAILYSTSLIWSALAGLVTALLTAFFKKGLFIVALSACGAVIALELLFKIIL